MNLLMLAVLPSNSYSNPVMKKASALIVGVMLYVYFVQTGHDVATRELIHVQNLYTTAGADAAAIASSNR